MQASSTLDELDSLLGIACSQLSEAAAAASAVGPEDAKPFKRALADALVRIWEARDLIHAQRPDLQPEFAREANADPASYEAYRQAFLLAHEHAAAGDLTQAAAVLSQFADSTSSVFFALAARKRLATLGGAI